MNGDVTTIITTGTIEEIGQLKEFNGNPMQPIRIRSCPPQAGQRPPEPVEFQVTVWGNSAHEAGRFPQGAKVLVAGKLKKSVWTPKNGGQPRESLNISASSIDLISAPAGRGAQPQYQPQQAPPFEPSQYPQQGGAAPLSDADIPFALDPIVWA
jgi:single-stranded DNA-binding protein